jgi:DNA-binding CsgD family transcriptional regulator
MPQNDFTSFDVLKKRVLSVIPADLDLNQVVVTPEQQQRELAFLKETVSNERFYFVVNMPDFELQHATGIQKWLGYPEKDFSLKKYWDYVAHPARKGSLQLIVEGMYAMLCNGKYPLQFMVQRFCTLLPVKHYQGHYLLTKKTASVFQYDKKNRLIAYLDEFTIIGEYREEPVSMRIINESGEREHEKEQEIREKAMERFLGMRIFSVNELQVARKLAYNPGITKPDIALAFNRSVHTIDTYYKRLLRKARSFFNTEFPTVFDVAMYLRNEGLL